MASPNCASTAASIVLLALITVVASVSSISASVSMSVSRARIADSYIAPAEDLSGFVDMSSACVVGMLNIIFMDKKNQ
jgi:hypothetical protein